MQINSLAAISEGDVKRVNQGRKAIFRYKNEQLAWYTCLLSARAQKPLMVELKVKNFDNLI